MLQQQEATLKYLLVHSDDTVVGIIWVVSFKHLLHMTIMYFEALIVQLHNRIPVSFVRLILCVVKLSL